MNMNMKIGDHQINICGYEAARVFFLITSIVCLFVFSVEGFDMWITLSVAALITNSVIGIIERVVDLQNDKDKRLYVDPNNFDDLINEDLPWSLKYQADPDKGYLK